MKFKSFEELECLLSEEERKEFHRWRFYKNLLSLRPCYMQTQHRILPYLPSWLEKKVVDVRELFECNNTSFGGRLLWNHVLTLSLDRRHEVTFAILDDIYRLEIMENVMRKVVEVYCDLQRLCKAYGHTMTLVSLQTDDFGMFLPPSFYDASINDDKMLLESRDCDHLSISVNEMIRGLSLQSKSAMDNAEAYAMELVTDADEQVARQFNSFFEQHRNNILTRTDDVCNILGKSGNDYYIAPMWDCIDIFMCDLRCWGREFCFKFGLEESLKHLKDLNRVRPLIDNIIKKTQSEDFAFGVKKRGTDVQLSDRVTMQNKYARSLSAHE